jgi:hypothetical protein
MHYITLYYALSKILYLYFVTNASKLQQIYAWARQSVRSKAVSLHSSVPHYKDRAGNWRQKSTRSQH